MGNSEENLEKSDKFGTLKLIGMLILIFIAAITAYPTILQDYNNKNIEIDTSNMDVVAQRIDVAMSDNSIYNEVTSLDLMSGAEYGFAKNEKGVIITFESKISNGKMVYSLSEAMINKETDNAIQIRELKRFSDYILNNIGAEVELKYYMSSDYTMVVKINEETGNVEVFGSFDEAEPQKQAN